MGYLLHDTIRYYALRCSPRRQWCTKLASGFNLAAAHLLDYRMLKARTLSALPGVRHAFFTREGGVSNGLYSSLNGGVGSDDRPDNVAENRERMAAALSVKPDHFITAY